MDIVHLRLSRNNLLGSLTNDFEGWTAYQFDQVSRTFRKALLHVIEEKGIPIPKGSYTTQIVQIIEAERSTENHPLPARQPGGTSVIRRSPYGGYNLLCKN
jgi:hypothetical protein